MFKDFHDRLFRQDQALRVEQARSNPAFHGRAGLAFIDIVGRRLWLLDLLFSAFWGAMFLALLLHMWAPETYAAWLEKAEKLAVLDLPLDNPWDYFMPWWFLTVVKIGKGFAEFERKKLIAEGRLPVPR